MKREKKISFYDRSYYFSLTIDKINLYQFSLKLGGKILQMNTKKGNSVYLQAIAMMHLATTWIEIRTVHPAYAHLVSNQVEPG